MRRLIILSAAATLALTGCDNSPNAKLEREVRAAVADLELPERPAFPSLNADTIERLSREAPELASHRAAIKAADEALLARAAADLARRYPPAAAGQVAAARPGSMGPVLAIAGWLIPAAHAQSGDGSVGMAGLSGMATGLLLGGIADSLGGKPGETGGRTETIGGSNGEKAVVTIARDADGQVTTSIESNVDVVQLGLQAGAKTTFITKSLCPDPSGRVEFTIKLSQTGKAGGGGAAAYDSHLEAHVTLSIDDNAALAEQDMRTRYSRRSSGKGGGVSHAGEADWHVSGAGGLELAGYRPGRQTGAVTEAMETSAITAAAALATGMITAAESHWQNGNCLRIDAQSPGRVDPKAQSTIPVAVLSKSDGGPVAARVTATLTGGQSIDPAVIGRTPGTLVHAAPDAKKAQMTIRLDAVSRRGRVSETLKLYISEGAYSVEGGADDFHGTGLICDIAQPFTVEGGGVTVNFTPSSAQGGTYRYAGSIAGFRLVGRGTYTVSYRGDVATAIVATGPGQVGTAYGMVSGSGDEHYELTPVHNYTCE